MFEDIVGQNVEVIVFFSNSTYYGASPITYYGTLLESTSERSVINATSISSPFAKKAGRYQGKVFINNNHIISMTIVS